VWHRFRFYAVQCTSHLSCNNLERHKASGPEQNDRTATSSACSVRGRTDVRESMAVCLSASSQSRKAAAAGIAAAADPHLGRLRWRHSSWVQRSFVLSGPGSRMPPIGRPPLGGVARLTHSAGDRGYASRDFPADAGCPSKTGLNQRVERPTLPQLVGG
jgi:hypothetical protein